MQLYSIGRILLTALASAALGSLYALLAILFKRGTEYFLRIVKLPYFALSLSRPSDARAFRAKSATVESGKIIAFLLDVLYTLCLGIGVLVINYVFCDGALRAYPAIILLGVARLLFVVSERPLSFLLDKLFELVYKPALFIFACAFYPFKKAVVALLERFVAPVFAAIRSKRALVRERKLVERKLAEVRLFEKSLKKE